MKTLRSVTIVAGLACALASPSYPLGQSSARSVAMGGAHIGLASGVDAARYNPANLGLSDHRQTSFELVGVGANISNNSFTLSDYNKYSGAFLTSQDKADIVAKIPTEGLKLTADVEASALGIASGSMAFTVTGVGVADINLNRDIVNLIFNGNTYADTIDVTGSYSDAVSYVQAGLSYGMPVLRLGSRQLAVGATAKYIRGIAIERVTELQGMIATYQTGFEGNGRAVAQTSTGGTGFGLDLGAALRLNNSYTVGLCIQNFLSTISWTRDTREYGYVFSFDTMTAANMDADYITSDDYNVPIPRFSSHVPSVMTAGVAKTSGQFLWAIDYEQGFKQAAGATTKPRLAGGAEWAGLKVLPLRAGFSMGGGRSASFSCGSGLNLLAYYLDVAIVTGSSLSGSSSKGLNFALSTGLRF
jgi:hypothetical protein